MYCELTEQKPHNQCPAPTTFFSPALKISGKKSYGIIKRNKTEHATAHLLYMTWKTSCLLCVQTFVCRWCCCTAAREWWKWPPGAQMGASSCRAVSPWEMNVSTGPAMPSSSPSHPQTPYPSRHQWLMQWTAFFVIWRGVCYYGWPQTGCSSSGSARAGCTGAVPLPNTLTDPTNWSEKRPSNCLIYPHLSTVRLCMHTFSNRKKNQTNKNS